MSSGSKIDRPSSHGESQIDAAKSPFNADQDVEAGEAFSYAACGRDPKMRETMIKIAALRMACQGSDDIKLSHKKDPEAEFERSFDYQGHFKLAVQMGWDHSIDFCIRGGVNPTAPWDYNGFSAIHAAAAHGHSKVLERLLAEDIGADVNASTKNGRTPLYFAVKNRRYQAAKLLLDKKALILPAADGGTPLHIAALSKEAEDAKMVQLLLDYGAEIDAPAFRKITPAMLASISGHHDIVQLLLERKADLAAVDEGGITALHYAINQDRPVVMKLLLDHGASIDVEDQYGWNIVRYALEFGSLNGISIVLKHRNSTKTEAQDLFDVDVQEWLHSKNVLKVAIGDNKSREAGTWTVHVPERATATSPESDHASGFDSIQVPRQTHSPEMYACLGFTKEKASKLWDHYEARSPATTFLDVAVDHISRISHTTDYRTKDWSAYMNTIGIAQELQSSMLDARFTSLRCTASCEYWLTTAITSRWHILLSLQETLIRVCKTSAATSGNDASDNLQKGLPPKDFPITGRDAIRLPGKTGEQPSPGEQGGEHASLDVATREKAGISTSYRLLWRGAVHAVMDNYFDEDDHLLTYRMTSFPGDFSGQTPALYMSPQRKVAEQYAVYQWVLGNNLKPFSHPSVLCVALPLGFLDKLHTIDLLQDDPKWRNVVFQCRRKVWFAKAYGRDNIDNNRGPVDLVRGHIASCHDEELEGMQSGSQIPDSMVFKVDGEYAIQWAFITEDSAESLSDAVQYAMVEDLLFENAENDEVEFRTTFKARVSDETKHKLRITEIAFRTRPGGPAQQTIRINWKQPDELTQTKSMVI